MAPSGSQKSGQRSGKQKKAALQEQRQRRREKEQADILDAYDEALLHPRVLKVVQARCYTYRVCRGGEVNVRLKLAIDRQLCAGYGVAATAQPPAAASDVNDAEETTEQKRTRQLRARATALSARLSATAKLKSRSSVEREWLECLNTFVQLMHTAATLPAAPCGDAWLFGLAQQALQTGPLNYGKPAQLKRLAKACAQDSKVSGAVGGVEHPHIRSVRRVLGTLLPLMVPLSTPQQQHVSDVANGGSSSGAGGTPDADDVSDDAAVVAEVAAEVEVEVAAEVAADGGGGGDEAMVAGTTGMNTTTAAACWLSEKQSGVVRGWVADFTAWCGGDVMPLEAPSAASTSESGRGRRRQRDGARRHADESDAAVGGDGDDDDHGDSSSSIGAGS